MKKVKVIFMFLCVTAICASTYSVFAGNVENEVLTVVVDANEVSFTDAFPYVEDGEVMLPVRAIAETIGCDVGWEEATGTVTIKSDSSNVAFKMNGSEAIVNGEIMTLRSPIEEIDGRTYMNYIDLIVCIGSRYMIQYHEDLNYVTIFQGNVLEVTEDGIKDWKGDILTDEELDAMSIYYPDGYIDGLKAESENLK